MSQQQRFEDAVRAAVGPLAEGGRLLAQAASLAVPLNDEMACGALHAHREMVFAIVEQVENEMETVNVRLAEAHEARVERES